MGGSEILIERDVSSYPIVAFVFACLGTVTMLIGLAFAIRGLWLVLPYSILECVALGGAYWWLVRQSYDYERISLDGDTLSVESVSAGSYVKTSFNRFWLSVRIEETRAGQLKLYLSSHGNRIEFGRFVPSSRKREIAAQIELLARESNREKLG